MIKNHLNRTLLAAASMLLVSGAAAQAPQAAAPGKANAAAHNAAEKPKGDDKPGAGAKADGTTPAAKTDSDKPEGKDALGAANAKNANPTARAATRAARRDAEHAGQREELRATIHGAMNDAVKQELRRHAHRVARLDRIKELAVELKDKDTVDRANKLLEKEAARHQKWMTNATTNKSAKAGAK